MNSETSALNSGDESHQSSQRKLLKSALLIVVLTVVFGALSYAFIQLNAAFMQLSVPESLWCGLAMSLAVVYYLFQKRSSTTKDN